MAWNSGNFDPSRVIAPTRNEHRDNWRERDERPGGGNGTAIDSLFEMLNGGGDKLPGAIDDLLNLITGNTKRKVAGKAIVKAADAGKKAKAKQAASKRAVGSSTGTGAAQVVDPRIAMAQQLLAPQGAGFDPNDKQFLKSKQKSINSALLAARAPWDNAIVNTRAGMKGAQAAVDRAQMGVAPVMQGTQRGQEMLAQTDRASLDAARDAAMLRQAQEAQAQARALGISEGAATEAGAAANVATQADAASQLGDVDRRTDNAKGLASSIQAASGLQAQETKQNIIRDSEREINRLRSQRTMGMAQARGSVEQEIAEFIKQQAGSASDAALERTKLGIALMNAASGDAVQREGIAARAATASQTARANALAKQQELALKMQLGQQGNQLDLYKLMAGMAGKSVRLTDPKSGKDVYAPAFPDASIFGRISPGGAFAPQVPAGEAFRNGISGILKGLF